jgi:hypothetical protein
MTATKPLTTTQSNAIAAIKEAQAASVGNRAYIVRSQNGRSFVGDGNTWTPVPSRTVEGLFTRGLIVRAGATTGRGWIPCRTAE